MTNLFKALDSVLGMTKNLTGEKGKVGYRPVFWSLKCDTVTMTSPVPRVEMSDMSVSSHSRCPN